GSACGRPARWRVASNEGRGARVGAGLAPPGSPRLLAGEGVGGEGISWGQSPGSKSPIRELKNGAPSGQDGDGELAILGSCHHHATVDARLTVPRQLELT